MALPGHNFVTFATLVTILVAWYLMRTEAELAVHLAATLVWAVCYEVLNGMILTVRTEAYYECIDRWMRTQIGSEFWAWLGHPVRDDWGHRHPAVACIVYLIKLFQIHIEAILLSRLLYWMPTTALPSVALKPVYLPIFMQRRPVLDSSASQWASEMGRRIPREALLSAFLFYVGLALEVRRRAHAPHSPPVQRRYKAFVFLFHDFGARVISQSLYQVLFPMYLLLRPLCGLQLMPLLTGSRLPEAYRQTATGYAVLDPVVAVLRTFLGPGNFWPTVYSILLLALGAAVMWLVAVCLFILWTACFIVIQLVVGDVEALTDTRSHFVEWQDRELIGQTVNWCLATLIFEPNVLHLLLRDSIPFPRLVARDRTLPFLVPAEREDDIDSMQAFNNECGLYY